jgi:3-methyl-2-oxobutanoate hydroxymethyltransferase
MQAIHPVSRPKPVTTRALSAMKRRGEKVVALTAYDYTAAQILDAAGVDLILVGDTLGMVVLGHETTLPVTLDMMIHHTQAVVRGTHRALVVGDMPFLTYQVAPEQALENAGRLMSEGGCKAVKLEGGREIAPTVERLVRAGIPVLGHLGYTPQSAHVFGAPRAQGRTESQAEAMLADALALEAAGACAVVLELVPAELAAEVSRRLTVPTIGIGSGVECDGEIQVFHDVFGLYTDFVPRHTRRYLALAEAISAAARDYIGAVRTRAFPGAEETVSMDEAVLERAVANFEGHGVRGSKVG